MSQLGNIDTAVPNTNGGVVLFDKYHVIGNVDYEESTEGFDLKDRNITDFSYIVFYLGDAYDPINNDKVIIDCSLITGVDNIHKSFTHNTIVREEISMLRLIDFACEFSSTFNKFIKIMIMNRTLVFANGTYQMSEISNTDINIQRIVGYLK